MDVRLYVIFKEEDHLEVHSLIQLPATFQRTAFSLLFCPPGAALRWCRANAPAGPAAATQAPAACTSPARRPPLVSV